VGRCLSIVLLLERLLESGRAGRKVGIGFVVIICHHYYDIAHLIYRQSKYEALSATISEMSTSHATQLSAITGSLATASNMLTAALLAAAASVKSGDTLGIYLLLTLQAGLKLDPTHQSWTSYSDALELENGPQGNDGPRERVRDVHSVVDQFIEEMRGGQHRLQGAGNPTAKEVSGVHHLAYGDSIFSYIVWP
jgi:hypothetical protein